MEIRHPQSANNLAAMMRHLVRATELERDVAGLTPLQWSALHFLALANGMSRTVSGFAAYNATSKCTASQVIKNLVEKALVRREQSPSDARSATLVLTEDGQRLVDDGQANPLTAAIESLAGADRRQLETLMASLMAQLRPPQGRVQLGSCHDCRHLGEQDGIPHCCRTHTRLGEDEQYALCAAHAPRESQHG